MAHLLSYLGCIIKDLDKILQAGLEVDSISKGILSISQRPWLVQTRIDFVLRLHQFRIELLQTCLILCIVPNISTVLIKVVIKVIIKFGESVSEVFQSLQEVLGVLGHLLTILRKHISPLIPM